MTPYQKALSKQTKSPTSPSSPTTTLLLERLVQWILCPHEAVSDVGILNPRVITEDIATFLSIHPHFHTLGMIEKLPDGTLRLWRKKDWDGQYSQWLIRQQNNIAETLAHQEKRERIERVISNLPKQIRSLSKELVNSLVLNMIEKADNGSEQERQLLQEYGYYL